jgi:hypothetical protein
VNDWWDLRLVAELLAKKFVHRLDEPLVSLGEKVVALLQQQVVHGL